MAPLVLCAIFAVNPPDLVMDASARAAKRAPATIRVSLPADAKLTFDGQATCSSSANRLFITPLLEKGKTFRYSLNAEIVRAGQTVAVQQDIQVQAGQETFVNLQVPGGDLGDSRSPAVYGAWSVARSYYGPYAASPPAAVTDSKTVMSLSGRPVSTSGFVPPRWGPDPSDPFYISWGH
jgi:uncharacterized protein (TIGR03000 family)